MLIKIKIKMMIKIDRLGNLFVNKLKLNNSKYAKSINNLISHVCNIDDFSMSKDISFSQSILIIVSTNFVK